MRHMERTIFKIVHGINTDDKLKWIGRQWLYKWFNWFGWRFVGRVLHVTRPEILESMDPERPFIMLANHRTFWDLFALSIIQYRVNNQKRIPFFPVRATFFYENPFGLLLNFLFAGGSMYPPVFRDPKKRRLNVATVRIIAELAGAPKTFLGFHPEGTRNRGDPHELLPGRSGTGRLVLSAWKDGAICVPVYMNGLHSWLPQQWLRNLRKSEPLNVVVGEPLDLSEFASGRANAATYTAITDRVMEQLQGLAHEERELRAEKRAASVSTATDRVEPRDASAPPALPNSA